MATDGGIYNDSGTFGISLGNGDRTIATNKGKLYSNHFYHSPFRSELHAILAGLTTIEVLVDYFKIQLSDIRLEIFSDCKKAVDRIQQRRNNRRTNNQYLVSDIDIELQIINTLEKCEFPVTIKLVAGHQEKKKIESELSYEERLNIEAHQLCIDGRRTTAETYHIYPTSLIDMTIDLEAVLANFAKIAIRTYHGINGRQFMKIKYNWSEPTVSSIWWLPHSLSLNALYINDRCRIQKFIHNRLPTRKRMKYRKPFKCNKCISCNTGDMKMKII